MTDELRVRKSPRGSLAVYQLNSPISYGWRVIHVGHGDAARLSLGLWITEQEAAMWALGRFGPDPVRVAEDEPEYVMPAAAIHEMGAPMLEKLRKARIRPHAADNVPLLCSHDGCARIPGHPGEHGTAHGKRVGGVS